MSLILTTHANKPAVEIEDHKGELWLYAFTLVSIPRGWAVRLAKIDPETGEAGVEYTVSNAREDWWECSCNDWKYRRRLRREIGGCKHIRQGRELKSLLTAMTGASP